MDIEELAAKHSNDFPGFRLVDLYEAAFPSYKLQLQVLMQVQRPIPVLDEFVLKVVDAGQTTIPEIAGLLGLTELSVVRLGIDNLQRRGYITLTVPQAPPHVSDIRIAVTPKGHTALNDLRLTEPEPGNFGVCQDALTGKYSLERFLRQPSEIKEFGYHEIPTFTPTPKLENLDFLAIKRLVKDDQRNLPAKSERRELIEILDLEKSWTAYRIMRVLQFVRPTDGTIQVEVFDGIERSSAHEAILLQMESEEYRYRPLRAVTQGDVPPSDPAEIDTIIRPEVVNAAKRKAEEAPKLEQEIQEKRSAIETEKSKLGSKLVTDRQEANHTINDLNKEIARLETRLQQMEAEAGSTEVLQMHEHRPKLFEALRIAQRQVIIVSPWMNPQSVDYELRQEIGKTLQRGVNVQIGHGFGNADRHEEKTLKNLEKIAQEKKGQLELFRLGDVHSKVLICDDKFMVLTSFNWLSFAGDPTRGTRVEDGMLTRDKKAIAQKTQEWLERFKTAQAQAN